MILVLSQFCINDKNVALISEFKVYYVYTIVDLFSKNGFNC